MGSGKPKITYGHLARPSAKAQRAERKAATRRRRKEHRKRGQLRAINGWIIEEVN